MSNAAATETTAPIVCKACGKVGIKLTSTGKVYDHKHPTAMGRNAEGKPVKVPCYGTWKNQ